MITIAFFNNKGGVGKTSLVYHLAWMFAEMEINVVAADLDPQANLTSLFLNEDRLEEIWPIGKHPLTIQGVIDPLVRGIGDIASPHVEAISSRIGLISRGCSPTRSASHRKDPQSRHRKSPRRLDVILHA